MTGRLVLSCPSCGAPLPHQAAVGRATCDFCGTTSVPERRAAPAETEARCPRCRGVLFEGSARGVSMLGCGGCGGVWLDNENAQRALSTASAPAAELAGRAAANAAGYVETQTAGIPCPVCSRPLERTRVRGPGVDVDLCREHGTWFDRNELVQVVTAARRRAAPIAAPPRPSPADLAVPDFRAGQGVDVARAALVAGGAIAVLGAVLSLVDR